MTIEEIQQTIMMFGKAAARVKSVGFDAIELHAHFHSIPGCFLSPLFNKRTDDYGGSFEKRLRFVSDVIASMREKVGPGFPLMIKYSINEFVEGGRDLEDGLRIARHFEKIGVDAIVVSQGQAGSKQIPYAPFYRPEGYMVPLAEALKKVVKIPVIVGGRLGDPEIAGQILEDGKADFISLGRPLIADPDLPKKVIQGRVKQIRRCVSDNYCFEVFPKGEMRCALNVTAGREVIFGEIEPAEAKKKIVIVGAGLAGMEAARVAGIKGHQVILFEKSDTLDGGQLALAAAVPQKGILQSVSEYYDEILTNLANVDVRLSTEATVETILAEKPDTVILATGGRSLIPNIPGIDGKNVVTAFDVLAGKFDVRGKNVVVCGGNAVGCETADYLAKKENKVTVVEMFDSIGRDIEFTTKSCLLDEMAQGCVHLLPGKRIEAFTAQGVSLIDQQGHKNILPMDVAVLALGVESVNDLAADLAGKVGEVYTIGDAKNPARIHDAVSDAFYMIYYL
jgi:NADPH-dependent 2,4-dienoyl-CoA reductase/sulfur reductase-like enzyme